MILTGIYDSGNKYRFFFNFVQSNMFPAQEHPQLSSKSSKRLNSRALFRIASQRSQVFQNAADDPICGVLVL